MSFFFPPEIEDEIFQCVIRMSPAYKTGAHLCTVSKRVRSCVEPILYQTLKFDRDSDYSYYQHDHLIHEDKFKIALKSKPKSFFRSNVKNVLFISSVSMEFVIDMLSICTGIQHLFLGHKHYVESIVRHVAALPLRSLYINMSAIQAFAELRLELSQVKYISFGYIDFYEDFDHIPTDIFQWLPELTHIAMPIREYNKYLPRALCGLRDIKQLQSIVVLLDDLFYIWGKDDDGPELIQEWEAVDSRILVVLPESFSAVRRWRMRMDRAGIDFDGYRYGDDRWSDIEEEDADTENLYYYCYDKSL
ncbi:hypothetical protein BDQ17DRAFT_1415239 [Cyathus striatus]|nr:hypothetical protein BDQ17DRAFT_1415239 [Cyathus striatus]